MTLELYPYARITRLDAPAAESMLTRAPRPPTTVPTKLR